MTSIVIASLQSESCLARWPTSTISRFSRKTNKLIEKIRSSWSTGLRDFTQLWVTPQKFAGILPSTYMTPNNSILSPNPTKSNSAKKKRSF
jgi:hypothetical protein